MLLGDSGTGSENISFARVQHGNLTTIFLQHVVHAQSASNHGILSCRLSNVNLRQRRGTCPNFSWVTINWGNFLKLTTPSRGTFWCASFFFKIAQHSHAKSNIPKWCEKRATEMCSGESYTSKGQGRFPFRSVGLRAQLPHRGWSHPAITDCVDGRSSISRPNTRTGHAPF